MYFVLYIGIVWAMYSVGLAFWQHYFKNTKYKIKLSKEEDEFFYDINIFYIILAGICSPILFPMCLIIGLHYSIFVLTSKMLESRSKLNEALNKIKELEDKERRSKM